MALLSRLHWWTVEYGLIGPLENPKIYGAGLLSSIGESVSCLEPAVKKIPYSIDAANMPFDITTKQPQLFVCRDFKHLADVLEEFASKMAFVFCSTHLGAHSAWRSAKRFRLSSTARQIKTPTIKSRSFPKSARSSFRRTRNESAWRIFTRKCARFA